jgi:hypothetical protein
MSTVSTIAIGLLAEHLHLIPAIVQLRWLA